MGMTLGFALFLGVMTGTVASIALGIIATVMTRNVARLRRKVWPLFAAGILVCQAALLTAIRESLKHVPRTKPRNHKGYFPGSRLCIAAIAQEQEKKHA